MAVGGADRMVCIWEVESGRILYKVCNFDEIGCCREDLIRARVSYLDTRVQSQLWTSTQRSQSVSSTQLFLVSDTEISTVLTGSKDGTMLLGEIEPGVSV